MKKNTGIFKALIVVAIMLSFLTRIEAQQQFPDIDPQWDKYYREHPSGISERFQGVDFIQIIEKVGFIPANRSFEKNVDLLKRVLLNFEQAELNQMRITGNYKSRTYKHDDYYYLYNSTYKKLTKPEWDNLCPYLIALMTVDGTIVSK
jgi:hypothetical protein